MVSRCFPGGYNVELYISRGRLAWWLLAFCVVCRFHRCLLFPITSPIACEAFGLMCGSVLQHILSPLHNLSSTTKRAALTAHFVAPCIHCRPKATKCAAVHGTFCRPKREREREREFIMLLKVIS